MTREEIFSPSDLVVRRVSFNRKCLKALVWIKMLELIFFFKCCSRQNLENSDDGSVGTLAVLEADWSVITKYRGVFDLMDINELSLSVIATVGCPLSCCAGADQLLTSDINPSIVTRTSTVNQVDLSPFEGSSLYQCGKGVDRPRGILSLFMIMSKCVCVTKPCGVDLEKAMKVKNINTSK